jgi:hypothetical protein
MLEEMSSLEPTNPYLIVGDEVVSPETLPPALWLGTRDDSGFVVTGRPGPFGSGFVCPYVFEGRLAQLLQYEAVSPGVGRWYLADLFSPDRSPENVALGREAAGILRCSDGATLDEALQQHAVATDATADDPRERWLAAEVMGLGALDYFLEPEAGPRVGFVPDGKIKCLVLPCTSARAIALRATMAGLADRFQAQVRIEPVQRIVLAAGAAPIGDDAREAVEAAVETSTGTPIVQRSRSTEGGRETLLMLQSLEVAYVVVIWRQLLHLVRLLAEQSILPSLDAGNLQRGQVAEAARVGSTQTFIPATVAAAGLEPGDFLAIYPPLDLTRLG